MIKQYKKALKHQQGLALITVLLVVALVTIIGTEMAIRLQMQITRSSNLQSNEQAFWYALGAEEFGKLIIRESMDADKGVIHLEQAWAMEGMVFPVEEGEIGGQISDLHSCFNLNSVYQKAKKGDQREAQAIRGRSNQNSLINNNQNAFLGLKIVEIIGEDEPHQLDPETIYFITNLLNRMNLKQIRNIVFNSALPLRA